jgi:protein-disulfide isomerase
MATELRNFLAASALALGIVLPALAGPAAAFEASEKKEIETIVREYLLANPGILLEMQQALEEHQMTAQREQQKLTIENAKMEIFMSSKDPVLGNPDGEVTVVEFFDYNCGYCKRAMSDMITMMENDSELKFVLKEFPILGPDSEAAHRVAFAFNDLHPEKYAEFHLRLLGFDGRATEDVAIRIATELGADETALRAEMDNPGIAARIQDTYQLANDLGINGTPAYVIGDEVVSGALGEKVLTKKVANLRECGSTLC